MNETPRDKKNGTILVATDFSIAGTRALELAAELARLRGASICLLNVVEPPSVAIPELALDAAIEEQLRRRGEEGLSSLGQLWRGRGIPVEERLEVGTPTAAVIAQVATSIAADLVVLGSHSRHGLSRAVLGSVAEAAVNRISQPVLVVPPPPAGASGDSGALAFDGAAAGKRWRIAVGIDLSNSSQGAVDWVRHFRRTVPCDITLIHLYWPAAEYARFGLPGPRDPFEPDAATIRLLERALGPQIAEFPGTGETTLKILPNWGSNGERLAEEAAAAGADLLVMGTHHRAALARLWHGSTVPSAVRLGSLPVLCVSPPHRAPAEQSVPRLRTVLVATDLSDLGNRAIPSAYSLVRAERGVVHLLYVHERDLPRPPYAAVPDGEGQLTVVEAQALRAKLAGLIPRDAAALGIATDVTVVDGGRADDVICQTAARLDVDAIAVGSHGRGGLARTLLGSVSTRVLHDADRPVFVVRHPRD